MDVVLKPEDTTDSIITSLPAFINNINENIDELIKVELIKEEAPSELMKLEEFDWGVDGIGHELQHEVNIKPDETSSEDPFESVNSNTPGVLSESAILNMESKKRCPKTTRQQYLIFLEELEKNEAFRCNRVSPDKPNAIAETWERLTISLNSASGPRKSTSAWKRGFTDWKSCVRKRARTIKLAQRQNGGAPPEKTLSDLESHLIKIIGKVSIDGLPDVPELGIDQTEDNHTGNVEEVLPSTSKKTCGKRQLPCEEAQATPVPIKKPNTSVSSTKEVLEQTNAKGPGLLVRINNNLSKLVEIGEKWYKLELLKLQLKYPDVEFSME